MRGRVGTGGGAEQSHPIPLYDSSECFFLAAVGCWMLGASRRRSFINALSTDIACVLSGGKPFTSGAPGAFPALRFGGRKSRKNPVMILGASTTPSLLCPSVNSTSFLE